MKSFTLNERADTRPNDRYWQFCVGSCHAALALRADYQRQLKRAHDELGFQRVRFHGIFDDDMQVVTSFHDYLPLPGSKKSKKRGRSIRLLSFMTRCWRLGLSPLWSSVSCPL